MNGMNYILTARLTSTGDGFEETCTFEYTVDMVFLEETGRDRTIYDPELKMYFEDLSALAGIYRADIQNIYLDMPKRLKKAADFIRRVNYRYNRMKIRMNDKGVVKSIENAAEIKSNWARMRTLLDKDYKGRAVDKYLAETDLQMASGDMMAPVGCYLNFGLMLPHIPRRHNREWNRARMIGISEYEDEQMSEKATYNGTVDGVREYGVAGSLLSGSALGLSRFEGKIFMRENEVFPVRAFVDIEYSNMTVDNKWSFGLECY